MNGKLFDPTDEVEITYSGFQNYSIYDDCVKYVLIFSLVL